MRRTIWVFLALLLITANPLWASGKIIYALDLSDSYYAAIPHFEDEIPLRSSNALAIAIGLIGIETAVFSASLDIHTMFVTPSIPFGNYQARGFNTVGFRLRGSHRFNNSIGLFASISSEANYYRTIKEAFVSYSVQVGPLFRVLQTEMHALDITVPVTIHLRKEITAPMLGVGIRYTLSPHKKQEKP
ncbi:MAG: hypothetical protein EOM68_04405 [Spirochaetia bacterium]|jgi:hypothetical protein|nr:hypothetical protein [Spirochaetia bacterium]